MQTNLKNSSVSTLVSVLMINAQGIMISVHGCQGRRLSSGPTLT